MRAMPESVMVWRHGVRTRTATGWRTENWTEPYYLAYYRKWVLAVPSTWIDSPSGMMAVCEGRLSDDHEWSVETLPRVFLNKEAWVRLLKEGRLEVQMGDGVRQVTLCDEEGASRFHLAQDLHKVLDEDPGVHKEVDAAIHQFIDEMFKPHPIQTSLFS